MHTKMKVNFVVMHFTHVSGHNGAQSNKLKLKFRKRNSFFFFKYGLRLFCFAFLAMNVGCFK